MATTTVDEYRTSIARKIGLDATDTADQTAIDKWLQEAYEDFLLETHVNVKTGVAATTVDVENYDLPTETLVVLEVHTVDTAGDILTMQMTSPADILLRRRASLATNQRGGFFATNGNNQLMIYPTPSEAYNITFYYVPRPTALSTTASIPTEIPSQYHKALEFYALSEAADEDDDRTSEQGNRYRLLYEGYVTKAKRANRWRGGRDFGVITLDRRSSITSRTSNDYY